MFVISADHILIFSICKVHVDFEYMLSNSPGKNCMFEPELLHLPKDIMEILDKAPLAPGRCKSLKFQHNCAKSSLNFNPFHCFQKQVMTSKCVLRADRKRR